jgi:hypothetical protein
MRGAKSIDEHAASEACPGDVRFRRMGPESVAASREVGLDDGPDATPIERPLDPGADPALPD